MMEKLSIHSSDNKSLYDFKVNKNIHNGNR